MVGRDEGPSEDPEKRRAILEQGIRTFAEFGFRGTDVERIAERAGVGKGTIYRYFRNKEGLFWDVTFEVMHRLERHIFAAMEDVEGAAAKLRASALAYVEFFEANPSCLELFVQERAEFRNCGPESHHEYRERLIQRFGEVFRQGIDAGELRAVDPRETILAMVFLIHGAVVLGSHMGIESIPQLVEHAIDVFLQGLRTESVSAMRGETT